MAESFIWRSAVLGVWKRSRALEGQGHALRRIKTRTLNHWFVGCLVTVWCGSSFHRLCLQGTSATKLAGGCLVSPFCKKASILGLPVDMLLEVLNLLDVADVLCFRLVSRHFCKLSAFKCLSTVPDITSSTNGHERAYSLAKSVPSPMHLSSTAQLYRTSGIPIISAAGRPCDSDGPGRLELDSTRAYSDQEAASGDKYANAKNRRSPNDATSRWEMAPHFDAQRYHALGS